VAPFGGDSEASTLALVTALRHRAHRIPKVDEATGPSAHLGEAAVRRATYAPAMNNPWLSLIAALSGQRIRTPSNWPVREVHRLCEVRGHRAADGSEACSSHGLRSPWVMS